MRDLGWADVAAGAIALAATVGILVVPPAYGFVGWDTYPILASSAVGSWRDLGGLFTECLTDDYFPFGFYRPAYSASMALDYAVWGLDPFGFRLTNALLFGVSALLVYRLARRLLGSATGVGPLAALVTLLVFPFHNELAAGPFAKRSDLLYALFVVLALLGELARIGSTHRSRHLWPALATLLAQASKESAIIVPFVVFVLVLLEERGDGRERLRRALVAAAWHAAAIGIVLAARTVVLGGMSGHASTSLVAAGDRMSGVLGRTVLALVLQWPAFAPGGLGDSLAALALVAVCAALAFVCLRQPQRDDVLGRAARTALLGATIVLACAGVFALVGWVAGWYLFLPSIGLALVCGAGMEVAAAAMARGGTRRAAAWAGVVVWAAWAVWLGSASPFVRPDSPWAEWTATSDAFLAGLRQRVEGSPPGSVITVPYPGRVLQPYSVQAWADLVVGRGRVRVVTGKEPRPRAGTAVTVVLVGDARRHG